MNKKLVLALLLIVGISTLFIFKSRENNIQEIRKKHTNFLANHTINKHLTLSKKERKALSLPPNAYFEQEFLNEINPYTLTSNQKELLNLQKELHKNRGLRRVPGDGSDNSWEERGPNNVGGRTRALVFDPNDATQETVFAGGVSGGLWKNTNISNSNSVWTQVGIPENLSISCIAIDPNDSYTWYIGTGETTTSNNISGNGVWKSTDGGATWLHIFGGVTGNTVKHPLPTLKVNSPLSIAGDYNYMITTSFGPELTTPLTGNLVLVDDGSTPTDDACTPVTNTSEINGNIALIKRGSCNFDDKIKRAQDAGAIAVLMVNNVTGNPIPMGGDDRTITIPSAMISLNDGNSIIAELNNGVNVTFNPLEETSGLTILPGVQFINDIAIRNNNGVSEVFLAVGDGFNSRASQGIEEVGVYKSNQSGGFDKLNFPNTSEGKTIAPNNIKIAIDNSIFVSSTINFSYTGGGQIFQSTDGTTFTHKHTVPSGARTEIALSKQDANTVYVLSQLTGSAKVGLYKTTNNFSTVTSLALPNDVDGGIPSNDFTRGQAYYDLLLKVDPNDDSVLYAGGIDLFKSTNSGMSWIQLSHWTGNYGLQYVHADQHGLNFSSSNRMVFSNDGGVYFSNNGGTSISKRNNGYNTLQFYTVAVAPTTVFNGEDYIIAGAQDNGTLLVENASTGINSFNRVYSGDGAYCFFDQDGTDTYYIGNYVFNNSVKLYDYNTNRAITINSESTYNGDFINQQDLDSNLDILYSNYSSSSGYKIRKYSNIKTTPSKSDLSNSLMNSAPSALKVSPFTTNQSNLFAGLKNGRLLKIERANGFSPIWSEITGANFVGSISDIEFGANEDEIFVTMHNYGVENIWYTNNGGNNWQSKEGDLPDIPVKAILQNPLNTKEVIIGTALGVWKTSNFDADSPNWSQSYNGMSNVIVTDLDLRNDNKVFAATYGRGVFSGTFTSDDVASVEEVILDKKMFEIYPTISNGNFTIFAKKSIGKTSLSIFDINGKKVYSKNADFTQNEKQTISINVRPGVYLVNLVDENNNKSTNKVIID